MAKIASFGAYVPLFRLARKEMGEAWGVPAVPGERAVANADEDSVTMGVAAGLDCLQGIDPSSVDGLFFATTTSPYTEKQAAGLIAAALDLRSDILTADFAGSIRSATTALRSAADAIDGGSAKSVLVVAADFRMGEPESMWEQLLGDGAAAVLVAKRGNGTIRGFQSIAGEQLGAWRRPEDRYVRSFEAKVETQYGYVMSVTKAAKAVLEKEKVAPADISKAVISGADPRAHGAVARNLGLGGEQLQDILFFSVGNSGAAQVLMMLSGALEQAKAGDRILVANYGDGGDAFLVEVARKFRSVAGRKGLAGHLFQKRDLPNYTAYAHFRNLMDREEIPLRSSAVTYWRDSRQELNFHGARCRACGLLQYPIPRVCVECGAKDQFEEQKLARTGTVYTFTLDHLVGGQYSNVPVPRLVVDLEGGGRVFLEMTDGDPKEVKVGLPVEVVFRRLHEGSEFHNYYWKCRPLAAAA